LDPLKSKLDRVDGEKTLGVILDKHLSWELQADYLIKKLYSMVHLLKRSKSHLTVHCRKLLYNALIGVKPVLEYCCSVWGNCAIEQLDRLNLKIQKRRARITLDAGVNENSVKVFSKLGWLPIDDIKRTKKLYICYTKLVLDIAQTILHHIIKYPKDTHKYNTHVNFTLPTKLN
jgi:hypothetical protein